MVTIDAPKRSPWGVVQYSSAIGTEGMFIVSTAGHGGIKVPAALNKRIDATWRKDKGWYEEDCEWAIVAVSFPESFPEESVKQAHFTARNYWPHEYMAVTGTTVELADSYELRRAAAQEAHKDAFVVNGAYGDWHEHVPAGMVGVSAQRQGETRHFLVPKEQYETRSEFGFVIDVEQHAAWDYTPR